MKLISSVKLIITLLLTGLLAACGGGSDSNISDPDQAVHIRSFTVDGSGAVVGGKTPINPAINGGAFQVQWEASEEVYHAEVWLSADDVLDTGAGSSDIRLLSRNCGILLSSCDRTGDYACRFTSENKISCDTDPERIITSFLDAVPKSAYLVLQVCNNLFTKCETSPVAIELQ